ncbi:hypothetical protein VKT23_003076 [Stygiomarasmius scandens]|uniref:Copper transport protein n=1 Tax=Marasmiellus scandens TaxID=2682957 RepID=A0ABR1K2G7_9AGAR
MFLIILLPLLLDALPSAFAHGMDMTMDDGDGTVSMVMAGNMLNYFHFTTGDVLFFKEWVTSSPGAVVGACLGLFVLAIFERYMAACKAGLETWMTSKAQMMQAKKNDSVQSNSPVASTMLMRTRLAPPFIPSHEITRGALHVVQAGLSFLLMLAVMTFHVGFIFAIIFGLGVGEVIFGRYISSVPH